MSDHSFLRSVLTSLKNRAEQETQIKPAMYHMLVLPPGESITIPGAIGVHPVGYEVSSPKRPSKFGGSCIRSYLPPESTWPKERLPYKAIGADQVTHPPHAMAPFRTHLFFGGNDERLASLQALAAELIAIRRDIQRAISPRVTDDMMAGFYDVIFRSGDSVYQEVKALDAWMSTVHAWGWKATDAPISVKPWVVVGNAAHESAYTDAAVCEKLSFSFINQNVFAMSAAMIDLLIRFLEVPPEMVWPKTYPPFKPDSKFVTSPNLSEANNEYYVELQGRLAEDAPFRALYLDFFEQNPMTRSTESAPLRIDDRLLDFWRKWMATLGQPVWSPLRYEIRAAVRREYPVLPGHFNNRAIEIEMLVDHLMKEVKHGQPTANIAKTVHYEYRRTTFLDDASPDSPAQSEMAIGDACAHLDRLRKWCIERAAELNANRAAQLQQPDNPSIAPIPAYQVACLIARLREIPPNTDETREQAAAEYIRAISEAMRRGGMDAASIAAIEQTDRNSKEMDGILKSVRAAIRPQCAMELLPLIEQLTAAFSDSTPGRELISCVPDFVGKLQWAAKGMGLEHPPIAFVAWPADVLDIADHGERSKYVKPTLRVWSPLSQQLPVEFRIKPGLVLATTPKESWSGVVLQEHDRQNVLDILAQWKLAAQTEAAHARSTPDDGDRLKELHKQLRQSPDARGRHMEGDAMIFHQPHNRATAEKIRALATELYAKAPPESTKAFEPLIADPATATDAQWGIAEAAARRAALAAAIAAKTVEPIGSVPEAMIALPKKGMDWKTAKAAAEKYCAHSAYPGLNKLIEAVGCSKSTMLAAIANSTTLRRLKKEHESQKEQSRGKSVRASQITDAMARTAKAPGLDPSKAASASVDDVFARLMESAKTPAERAKLNAMTDDEKLKIRNEMDSDAIREFFKTPLPE